MFVACVYNASNMLFQALDGGHMGPNINSAVGPNNPSQGALQGPVPSNMLLAQLLEIQMEQFASPDKLSQGVTQGGMLQYVPAQQQSTYHMSHQQTMSPQCGAPYNFVSDSCSLFKIQAIYSLFKIHAIYSLLS